MCGTQVKVTTELMIGLSSQRKYGPLFIVCWRGERPVLGTTHAIRAIYTHAVSTMNTHIDANDGLVSNPSDREIQGSSAHAAAPNLHVGISSWDEPHIAKRDIGQRSNRKLNEPSAPECRISAYLDKLTGRALDGLISCFLVVLKRRMNDCVGIVLGGPLQIGLASCRDGNTGACSSLGQGNPKSKSLFHS